MKRFACAIALSVSVITTPVIGQGTHIGIGGGSAIPVGKFDSTRTAGPQGMVMLVSAFSGLPLGFRLDYTYNAFNGKSVNGLKYGKSHMSAVTANIVATFSVSNVKPYFLAGGGWYPYRDPAVSSNRINSWGANAGAGITFPIIQDRIGAFVEARYHVVYGPNHAERRFVPVSIGVLF